MKKMKKLLAVLMTLAMVMGLGMTSFAAEEVIGNSDDRGTITVNGIEDASATVKAYPIVKATYDENENFDGYEVVYAGVTPVINKENTDENGKVVITQEHLNAIIPVLDESTAITMSDDAEEFKYTANVPVGSYLVMVTGAEAKSYSAIVVSVNYLNEAGKNAVEAGTVEAITGSNAWTKVTNLPTAFTKTELDLTGITDGENEKGNSVNAGSEIEYTLTINTVPYYGGKFPVFNVVDEMQPGLAYVADSLKVTVDGEAFNNYDLTVDGQVITIDFAKDYNYTLNASAGKKVEITYKATLETAGQFNENGYKNSATLNYTTDSKTEGNNKSLSDRTYTYTFDITNNIIKVDEAGNPLANAKFAFYTKDTTDGYNNSLMEKALITDANGRLELKGLEAGTYYLQETEAPTGYSVNTHEYEIVIEAEYGEDGELNSYTVKVDGEAITEFAIPNTKLASLPSTGGIGTTIFTIGGCAIMVAAAYMYFVSRRKEEEQ